VKEDSVYIKHILDAVNDIEEFVKGMNKENFLSNKAIEYAVVRSIETIGEASKHPLSFLFFFFFLKLSPKKRKG